MEAKEVLALIGGHVNEELLLRNEYLAAENQIMRKRLPHLRLDDEERVLLAGIAKRMGRKALKEVGPIFKPDTIFRWFSRLIAEKFDGTAHRKTNGGGRPPVTIETENETARLALENPGWGNHRISGELAKLGLAACPETVAAILRSRGIPPAPHRKPGLDWQSFIRIHQNSLAACDFFTAEVMTPRGLVTLYALFFMAIASRKVHLAGVTTNPDKHWMKQIARNVTMWDYGFLWKHGCTRLIHDGDGKFCPDFRKILRAAGVKPKKLPPSSPNLNAYAERWIRSIRSECLNKMLFFSQDALLHALNEYVEFHNTERPHQGKDNRPLSPQPGFDPQAPIRCQKRLGGLLKHYYRGSA